jgi:hypothetical protein
MCNPIQSSFLQSNLVGLLTIIIGAAFVIWQTRYTIRKQNQWALDEQRYAIFCKAHDLFIYYTAKKIHEDAGTAIPPYHDKFGNEYDPRDIRLAVLPLLARRTKMSIKERISIQNLIENVKDLESAEKFHDETLRNLAPELMNMVGKTASKS